MKALKELGQHFLTSSGLAETIAGLGDLHEGDRVWEIGPGKGILTEALLQHSIKLRAFELDRRLYEPLQNTFGNRVDFVFGDVLRADWPALIATDGPHIKLIANIPYQITTPLLARLEQHKQAFNIIVLMVQKELGERLCALAGSKSYAPLTIRLRLSYVIKPEIQVPRTAFEPMPHVDSMVISMLPRLDTPQLNHPEVFNRLLDAAFAHRRKTLANNLQPFLGKDKFLKLRELSDMDFSRRGESLDEAEFIRLADLVAAL